ncbi:hypothetical protein NM688_g6609 [Phlebia brevispora]|uniref:Uncharacterized protein n=1 Tax=Phlebia brevispora TaxID=194682 RepID=A0ACC1SEF1_9APHY|nr:hypothetical protein NM688_g6609 [Phlebia brevispora]
MKYEPFKGLTPQEVDALTRRQRLARLESFVETIGRHEVASNMCIRHQAVYYPRSRPFANQQGSQEKEDASEGIERMLADLAAADEPSTLAEDRVLG